MTKLQLNTFLIITCFIVACGEKNKSNTATTATTVVLDTVPVFVLANTPVNKTIELSAELLPYEKADLAARVEGYVRDIRVDIGDRVSRGQTLAAIDAPEMQTKYAEYQAALSSAESKYNSSKDVYQRLLKASQAKTSGIVAPVELERSRNQKLADSASYQGAKRLAQSYLQVAGYLNISAPFSGIISSRNADRGALVGANTNLFTIQNTSSLRLRVAVPELYVSAVPMSKAVSFKVESNPNKLFTAELVRKSGAIDPINRTETWEYRFNNVNNELMAGSFAYVQLHLSRSGNSFVVPPTAIATNQERRFVIVVKNNKTQWVDIRQGMSTEGGVEIFGNIANGDTIVVRATDERKPETGGVWRINP